MNVEQVFSDETMWPDLTEYAVEHYFGGFTGPIINPYFGASGFKVEIAFDPFITVPESQRPNGFNVYGYIYAYDDVINMFRRHLGHIIGMKHDNNVRTYLWEKWSSIIYSNHCTTDDKVKELTKVFEAEELEYGYMLYYNPESISSHFSNSERRRIAITQMVSDVVRRARAMGTLKNRRIRPIVIIPPVCTEELNQYIDGCEFPHFAIHKTPNSSTKYPAFTMFKDDTFVAENHELRDMWKASGRDPSYIAAVAMMVTSSYTTKVFGNHDLSSELTNEIINNKNDYNNSDEEAALIRDALTAVLQRHIAVVEHHESFHDIVYAAYDSAVKEGIYV